MKLKSVNFSASNAKRSVKFASVNENSLHGRLIIMIVCLLFERIANGLVNDTQVYSLCYSLRLFVSVLFANVNASLAEEAKVEEYQIAKEKKVNRKTDDQMT